MKRGDDAVLEGVGRLVGPVLDPLDGLPRAKLLDEAGGVENLLLGTVLVAHQADEAGACRRCGLAKESAHKPVGVVERVARVELGRIVAHGRARRAKGAVARVDSADSADSADSRRAEHAESRSRACGLRQATTRRS